MCLPVLPSDRTLNLCECALDLPGARANTRETHFFAARERKPISLRPRAGVAINCRIASKTILNCLSYLLSSSSNRRESSTLDTSICRSFTNARMISMLTVIARLLRKTLESIATPCSVKAKGGNRGSRCFSEPVTNCDRFKFEMPIWHLKTTLPFALS